MSTVDLRPLSDTFSVAGQILPDDIKAIKDAGFKSVICNRPDGEEPGMPTFDVIRDAAQAEGLTALYLPITHGGLSEDQIAEFEKALDILPGPILAYCRSGARSAMLWTTAEGKAQGQAHQNA